MNEAFETGAAGQAGTETPAAGKMVSFGKHYAASDQFDAIFREGMGLVEKTAAYLDGPGRRESKALKPPVSMAYATESMRLTTRLLELASWLLVRRSLRDGEITATEARTKRARMKLGGIARASHVKCFHELPLPLQELIATSFSLQDRILRLDHAIEGGPAPATIAPAGNPVADQMAQIEAAFGQRG